MAKRCVIMINRQSGRGEEADEAILGAAYGQGFDTEIIYIADNAVSEDLNHADRIVVCGGDGTLNLVLNSKTNKSAEIIYCPYGTLNETAAVYGAEGGFSEVGKAGNLLFSYVFAAGIFTPLGYAADIDKKKKYKVFAYLSKVLREYKIYDIEAKIQNDEITQSGRYALIMAINSPRCFGLRFNRAYRHDDGALHLLAIRTPKNKGFLGKCALFFPLFRAFFIGFRKNYSSKNILFFSFDRLKLDLESAVDFCVDGEKRAADGEIEITSIRLPSPVTVVRRAPKLKK